MSRELIKQHNKHKAKKNLVIVPNGFSKYTTQQKSQKNEKWQNILRFKIERKVEFCQNYLYVRKQFFS